MAALHISFVRCTVPSLNIEYEMFGYSGFPTYGTFILNVKIRCDAGKVRDLPFTYNIMLYLTFPKMCFAGLGTLAELMQVSKPSLIKTKCFSMVCNHTRNTRSVGHN